MTSGQETALAPASEIKRAVRAEAAALGFDVAGFAAVAADPKARAALDRFVGNGYAGDMAWLAREDGRRGDPGALMAGAKSAIVVGMNYGPAGDPLAALADSSNGSISIYARSRDYHDVIKKRLKRLARWIGDAYGAACKVYVDTAPLMEKPLAQRGGVGWLGKHTNLVSRRYGSWLFLGEILTTLELPPDAPEADHCGSCDRCLKICPTDAFPAPYELDPRRCISYLTIEHKGAIADELMDAMGNRVYGCDDCLAACPWTKFTEPGRVPDLAPRPELAAPDLVWLSRLDDAAFREMFSGSPIKRTGRDRFVRNVLIAIGNAGDPSLADTARRLLDDPSPLVAAAARRAVEKLSGG